MNERSSEVTGYFPPSGEFAAVFGMHRHMGPKAIHETFPCQLSPAQPIVQVELDHLPETQIYNFNFTPTGQESLEGKPRKMFEAVVKHAVPAIQLSVFTSVIHKAFSAENRAEWIKFQSETGLFLPNKREVNEFLLIFGAFTNHIMNQRA